MAQPRRDHPRAAQPRAQLQSLTPRSPNPGSNAQFLSPGSPILGLNLKFPNLVSHSQALWYSFSTDKVKFLYFNLFIKNKKVPPFENNSIVRILKFQSYQNLIPLLLVQR